MVDKTDPAYGGSGGQAATTPVRNNATKGLLFALAGTASGSTAYVTAKYAMLGFSPQTFVVLWMSAAAIYALALILARGQQRCLVLARQDLRWMAVMGLMIATADILAFAGLSLMDSSLFAFLMRFLPVLTILLGVLFLRERLKLLEIVPIALMVLGGSLDVLGKWNTVGTGTLLALLSCGASAGMMLLGKKMVANIPPIVLSVYSFGIGAPIAILWAIVTGGFNLSVPPAYWLVTLLGALFGPFGSWLLYFISYSYWDLSRTSIVLTAEPLFVLPLAFLVFHSFPTGIELFGGVMILGGALCLAYIHRQRPAIATQVS